MYTVICTAYRERTFSSYAEAQEHAMELAVLLTIEGVLYNPVDLSVGHVNRGLQGHTLTISITPQ